MDVRQTTYYTLRLRRFARINTGEYPDISALADHEKGFKSEELCGAGQILRRQSGGSAAGNTDNGQGCACRREFLLLRSEYPLVRTALTTASTPRLPVR